MSRFIYFTNDEGVNVVTSNPDDEPVMLSEYVTMASGVRAMIFCKHTILTTKILISSTYLPIQYRF